MGIPRTLEFPISCVYYGERLLAFSEIPMPNRKSPRHPHFDYRSVAAYFVTICAYKHRHIFGTVVDGHMEHNAFGRIVVEEWHRSDALRDNIVLDAFVCMPNHVHGIVCIVPSGVTDVSPRGYRLGDAATFHRPSTDPSEDPPSHRRYVNGRPVCPAGSVSSMIGGFKGAATRRIRTQGDNATMRVWHSRFDDHILRDERDWRTHRRYIDKNPIRWWQEK